MDLVLADVSLTVDPALLPGTSARAHGVSITLTKSTTSPGHRERLLALNYELANLHYLLGSHSEAADPPNVEGGVAVSGDLKGGVALGSDLSGRGAAGLDSVDEETISVEAGSAGVPQVAG